MSVATPRKTKKNGRWDRAPGDVRTLHRVEAIAAASPRLGPV